jgi:hypothetical protein
MVMAFQAGKPIRALRRLIKDLSGYHKGHWHSSQIGLNKNGTDKTVLTKALMGCQEGLKKVGEPL